jgi:hypothetical protein
MKLRVGTVLFLFAASLGFSQMTSAPSSKDAAAKEAPSSAKKGDAKAPAGSVKAAKPADAKKAPPKIDGAAIERAKGGYLGLKVVGNNFVLSFYDREKAPIAADVARATLRWPVKYQPSDERTVLNPAADGKSLTSGKTVKPPFLFKVYLSLFVEGNDQAVENYVVDYHE